MMPTNHNEFIEIARPQIGGEIADFLNQFSNEKTRAVVLIVENSLEIGDENLYATLESFPVPVILALKVSAAEKLVAAAHLCVAAENASIGNLPAEEALKRGLINKITPAETVETETFALAEKIAALAPLAVRACLKAVVAGAKLSLEEGLKIERELFAKIFATADMREGTRAFLEKRKPIFRGE